MLGKFGYTSGTLLLLSFQHPFVRDAVNVKPIKDLLSEAGAEVIIDQIDIDDTDLKVSTVSSDRDFYADFTWGQICTRSVYFLSLSWPKVD